MPCSVVLLLTLFILIEENVAAPVGSLGNSTLDIKNTTALLPPDHLAGAHSEHDGDINKDFHHEAFLATLVDEKILQFKNMDGYKKLIRVFHRVDKDKDHLISKDELQDWIHDRILEHYKTAKEDSDKVFNKVDTKKNGEVSWADYKAQLLGMNISAFEETNVTEDARNGSEFATEAKHWINADFNGNGKLNSSEFLTFLHPEKNKITLKNMAKRMMSGFDKDKDQKISLEEFTTLPPGDSDTEQKDVDEAYVKELTIEFKNDMDADGDGYVTLEELVNYLDPRHIQHAIKEAEYLIRVADRNRDKKLNEREVLLNYAVFTGSSLTNYAAVLHNNF